MEDKNLPILHGQYHGRWCSGDARNQSIGTHDTEYAKPELSDPRTVRLRYRSHRYGATQFGNMPDYMCNYTTSDPIFINTEIKLD